MRKLLNTLFVTSEDAYLALENENVVVYKGDETAGRYPLQLLEGILCFSYKGASPALMGACAHNHIQLTFLTPNGKFLARAAGESQGNVLLRREQYRVADNPACSCLVARNMIFGKVYNSRWVIERTLRDHAMRVDAAALGAASARLQAGLEPILHAEELDALLSSVRAAVAAARTTDWPELRLSVSIGSARGASSLRDALREADRNMYRDKTRSEGRTGT